MFLKSIRWLVWPIEGILLQEIQNSKQSKSLEKILQLSVNRRGTLPVMHCNITSQSRGISLNRGTPWLGTTPQTRATLPE